MSDSATSLLFVVSLDTLIVLASRESQLEFKLLSLPGLAKVAGALANGPREAMGEELALVRPPRRRAAANLDAFLGEDCEVATSKGADEVIRHWEELWNCGHVCPGVSSAAT